MVETKLDSPICDRTCDVARLVEPYDHCPVGCRREAAYGGARQTCPDAAVLVFNPHNIVLAEVAAGLYFDDQQRLLADVL